VSFWLHRPSPARALAVLAGVGLLTVVFSRLAGSWSPLEVRANLPLEELGMREVFLTSLAEDPARVLLTTRRENSTWTRDANDQRGDTYWIRRYGDPARPGLSERILLTSRSRGAHFLIPIGAVDLERALNEPSSAPAEGTPSVRVSLAQVYLDRNFAGIFLELRFPERPLSVPENPMSDVVDFDLVAVRGNQVRTTDFLLQPNGRFYRDAIAAARLPLGPLARNEGTGDELVFALWEDARRECTPLFVPIPLFDELGLCWGANLPALTDDRWRVELLPAYPVRPVEHERALVTRAAALQVQARLDSLEEQHALILAAERLGDS
jgi:hypothetical protein